MKISDQLATSLGRRDEVPNQELAAKIAKKGDKAAVKELVELLKGKDKNLQSDALKALYETGYLNPALIAPYHKDFFDFLDHKNNRLVWGAMTALDSITAVDPKPIQKGLSKILEIANKGSVITRDHAVKILAQLAGNIKLQDDMLVLLLEQLQKAPYNQFPSYAETISNVMNDKNKNAFIRILNNRLKEITHESKIRNIQKILKKMGFKTDSK